MSSSGDGQQLSDALHHAKHGYLGVTQVHKSGVHAMRADIRHVRPRAMVCAPWGPLAARNSLNLHSGAPIANFSALRMNLSPWRRATCPVKEWGSMRHFSKYRGRARGNLPPARRTLDATAIASHVGSQGRWCLDLPFCAVR